MAATAEGRLKRPLADPEDQVADGLQPVDEDRLVETGCAVEIGEQEVTALEHLPGGFGEGAFVHVEQRRAAEPEQEGEQGQGEDQAAEDAAGERRPWVDGYPFMGGPRA
jgi:hypothetical protein